MPVLLKAAKKLRLDKLYSTRLNGTEKKSWKAQVPVRLPESVSMFYLSHLDMTFSVSASAGPPECSSKYV